MNNNNLGSFRVFLYHKWVDEDQPETEISKPAKAETPKVGVKPKAGVGLLQAIRSFFL